MNTLNIKEWAQKQDKELRAQIDYYIKEGVEKKQAVKMVLDSSTLGQGYNAQIRYDYLGFKLN